MQFHFRGDDDVFLYIDGVLVLDLGGVHGITEGHIDFATGVVRRASNSVSGGTEDVSLYQRYVDALGKEEADKIGWIDVDDPPGTPGRDFEDADYKIFKKFTSHSFAFYYFERGEGESDCYCAFNLPTIPEGQLEIGKHIDSTEAEAEGAIVDKSGNFYYKVQQTASLDTPNWADYDGDYDVYKGEVGDPNKEYITTRHSGSVTTKSGKTLDGVIYIEDGQVAVLRGYGEGTYFQAVEFDPAQSGDVDINGLK